MGNVLLLSVFWLFYISVVHCTTTTNPSKTDSYSKFKEIFDRNATNCTRYIPADILQIMRENDPSIEFNEYSENSAIFSQMVPEEYLFACLRKEFKHKNDTSPFSFTNGNVLEYNVALNELVSLSFDGTLITKALSFLSFFSI